MPARKTGFAIAAVAAMALLVPSTAPAAPGDGSGGGGGALGGTLGGTVGGLGGTLGGTVTGVGDTAGGTLGGVGNTVGGPTGDVIGGVGQTVDGTLGGVGGTVEGTLAGAGGTVGEVTEDPSGGGAGSGGGASTGGGTSPQRQATAAGTRPPAQASESAGGDRTGRSDRAQGGRGGTGTRADAGVAPAAGASTLGPAGPTGASGFAEAADRRQRRSVVERIVERIPVEYRIALLALGLLAALFGATTLRERRRSRHARAGALSDPLTGLANRNGLTAQLEREWKRARRYEGHLGLLLIDLDDFKQINDTRGHLAGDRVLREAAAAIAGRVRETDYAARFGGDEFVVLCPETPSAGLSALADSLLEALARHSIKASVGFTELEPTDDSPNELIARADAQMYRHKRGRRDSPEPAIAA